MRTTGTRTRRVAAAAAVAVALAACQGDPDEGADDAVDATDADGTDDDVADGADDGAEADDAADTDDGTAAEEAVPPAESVVTIESLDAPQSSIEIRVGEIILEFDGEVTDEGTVMTLEEPILFDFDSSTLKSAADGALDDIAEVLAFYDEADVQVIGHTDDVGSADYNRTLSTERAEAVYDALVRRGIPEGRMSSEGRGFDDPAVPNDSDENRAINRRVEVIVLGVEPPDGGG